MTDIITFKLAATEKRRAQLETHLRELGNPFGQRDELQIVYSADPVDQVKSATDRDIVVTCLDEQTHQAREVQAALSRLEGGSYGACEKCEDPIAPKRLDAVPWAKYCVTCQESIAARIASGDLAEAELEEAEK